MMFSNISTQDNDVLNSILSFFTPIVLKHTNALLNSAHCNVCDSAAQSSSPKDHVEFTYILKVDKEV